MKHKISFYRVSFSERMVFINQSLDENDCICAASHGNIKEVRGISSFAIHNVRDMNNNLFTCEIHESKTYALRCYDRQRDGIDCASSSVSTILICLCLLLLFVSIILFYKLDKEKKDNPNRKATTENIIT